MRDIIFRAKSFQNGEWVYGSLIAMDSDISSSQVFIFPPYNGASSFPCSFLVSNNMTEVDPETVGQYTGLTDKNGKKIFEGDIIRLDNYYGEGDAYVVCWDSYNCEYILDRRNQSFGLANIAIFLAEVIGNIHDNPELLGGADNGE